MKNNSITDPLYIEIERKIDWCKRKTLLYTLLYYSIKLLFILLTAAITVCAAYGKDNQAINITVIWLGAMATVLTAVDTLYQSEKKKSTYNIMLHDYRVLRTDYALHYYEDGINDAQRSAIKKEYQRINNLGRDLLDSNE